MTFVDHRGIECCDHGMPLRYLLQCAACWDELYDEIEAKAPKPPKIIRKVLKMGRDGRVKLVRDYREGLTLERVVAQMQKPCSSDNCFHGGTIFAGSDYANLSDGRRWGSAGKSWPLLSAYHFECLPGEAEAMVRFFE